MANPNLPKDIMVEIFLRLPTKSVGRCRCLSKTWAVHLSIPQFIQPYVTFRSRQENLFLLNPTRFLETIALPIKDDNVSRKVRSYTTWKEMAGSCHGLVLMLNMEYELFLVNPITYQHTAIPNSYLRLNNIRTFRCGFGYDSSTDDYKILVLSYCDTTKRPGCHYLETALDVYTVKSMAWRRIKTSPDHAINGGYNGAFINGAVHWYSNSKVPGYPSKIYAFDLADEVFREVPPPIRVCDGRFSFRRLCVLEGCLCMVDSATGENDIYIMKEYGNAKSWTKFSIYPKGQWDVYKPLCFIGDKEIVLVTFSEDVVVYNFEDETTRRFVVDGVPTAYVGGVVFMEGLVSPNIHAALA